MYFIVTMFLSFTVSETFNIELYLEFCRIRGYLSSLKIVSFKSFGTVSYSYSIATTLYVRRSWAVSLDVLTQYTNVADRHTPHDSKGSAFAYQCTAESD